MNNNQKLFNAMEELEPMLIEVATIIETMQASGGIHDEAEETKSKRVQLLVKPSTFEKLKEEVELQKKSGNEKASINDLVNKILQAYFSK